VPQVAVEGDADYRRTARPDAPSDENTIASLNP
jgi:hypothetical protein